MLMISNVTAFAAMASQLLYPHIRVAGPELLMSMHQQEMPESSLQALCMLGQQQQQQQQMKCMPVLHVLYAVST